MKFLRIAQYFRQPPISTTLFILLATVSVSSQGNEVRCRPYLVSRAELAHIFASNIRGSALSDPQIETSADQNCPIRLIAKLSASGTDRAVEVRACTRPVHNTYSIGFSEIHIINPIRVTIRTRPVDVSSRIISHCGRLYPISATPTTIEGVFLMF